MNQRLIAPVALAALLSGLVVSAVYASPESASPAPTDEPLPPTTEFVSPSDFRVESMAAEPAETRRAPASFAADLKVARQITGFENVGDPCENGDPTWLETGQKLAVAAVAGEGRDGSCVVVGWAYNMPTKFDFTLPLTEDGYILQPVFDDNGVFVDFFGPGVPTSLPPGATGPTPGDE